MRPLTALTLFAGLALMTGCQRDDSQVITVHELEITPEQAAQIKSQDQIVFDEEGGPQKVIRPNKGKR